MKKPEINDWCEVKFDGRNCFAKVIEVNESCFDVITSFGEKMHNIPFAKFLYSSGETAIRQYDSLAKIVKQLEMSEYECEGGVLKNNVAFISLRRMALAELTR